MVRWSRELSRWRSCRQRVMSLIGGERVEGAGVADERHQHRQDGQQRRAGVADVEVAGDVAADLGVGPAEGGEHGEGEQFPGGQVDAAAGDGVAEAVAGQVALEVLARRRGVGVHRRRPVLAADDPLLHLAGRVPAGSPGVLVAWPGSGSSTPAAVRMSLTACR